MNYHKLLSRQIAKFLPAQFAENPELQKFFVCDKQFLYRSRQRQGAV